MTVRGTTRRRGWLSPLVALVAVPALAVPVAAQQPDGCGDRAAATLPATPPSPGDGSGTNPGATGSTGWTGGTGGSQIGTTHAGPTPGSPTEHPQTAQGVNPVPTPADPNSGPRPSC